VNHQGHNCFGSLSHGTTMMREDYLRDPDYFMALACLSAKRSKDPSTQMCVCVCVCLHGYIIMCHAELNAIMNKNSADVKGCTMYVTLFPCNKCAKLIIQAGIRDVVFLSDKYHTLVETEASRRLLSTAEVISGHFSNRAGHKIIYRDPTAPTMSKHLATAARKTFHFRGRNLGQTPTLGGWEEDRERETDRQTDRGAQGGGQ
uniref:dCMP deaminase n=1 Tax=Dicentrarchus labrax TaxID=13489 RepID=A0A8C4GT76_DICLA